MKITSNRSRIVNFIIVVSVSSNLWLSKKVLVTSLIIQLKFLLRKVEHVSVKGGSKQRRNFIH